MVREGDIQTRVRDEVSLREDMDEEKKSRRRRRDEIVKCPTQCSHAWVSFTNSNIYVVLSAQRYCSTASFKRALSHSLQACPSISFFILFFYLIDPPLHLLLVDFFWLFLFCPLSTPFKPSHFSLIYSIAFYMCVLFCRIYDLIFWYLLRVSFVKVWIFQDIYISWPYYKVLFTHVCVNFRIQ